MKYWKVKVVGDQMIHNRANGDPITHAVVLVKNTRWPGTLCVWKEEKFANIYVGFGIKAIDSPYTPTQLGTVDKDPNDEVCVIVNLGSVYELDEIYAYHRWGNTRSTAIYGHNLSLSTDNIIHS